MNRIGSDSLNRIQELLSSKKKKQTPQTPPKAEQKSKSKSPVTKTPLSRSPHRAVHTPTYQPMGRDYNFVQQQVRSIHNEMEEHLHFRVQNKHSYYLNSKNPKPPLYQRALQMAKEREVWLEEKRQQKLKEKEEAELQEEEEALSVLAQHNRVVSKQEAYEISERLYKEHYNKASRQNQKQVLKRQEESLGIRSKPLVSEISKEIFKLYTEKNQLENDVFQRFEQYQASRKKKQQKEETEYKNRYCPFAPLISETSRMILSNKKSTKDLSRSNHCVSCSQIRREKSTRKNNSDKKAKLRKTFIDNKSTAYFM